MVKSLAILVLIACGSSKDSGTTRGASGSAHNDPDAAPKKPASNLPRLFTDAEIDAYERALSDRLASNATRKCVNGSAGSTKAIELFEMTGPVETCKSMIDNTPNLNQQLIDGVTKRTPEVIGFERTCGPLFEARVIDATQRGTACSPYQIGVRVKPNPLSTLTIAHTIGLRARIRAEEGEPRQALPLLIAGMQLAQDLGRGNVTMITSVIANVSSSLLVDHAREILGKVRLPEAQIVELAQAIDALLAATSPVADTLQGELAAYELFMASAPAKATNWVPPGGWDEDLRGTATSSGKVDPRDEAAIQFVVVGLARPKLEAACAQNATIAACHQALAKLAAGAKADTQSSPVVMELLTELVRASADKAPDLDAIRVRIRTRVATVLAAMMIGVYGDTAARKGAAVARLVALRIHLEVQRSLVAKGRCPTGAELAAEPFGKLASTGGLGERVQLTRTPTAIRIEAPAWTETSKPSKPPYEVACPS